MTDQSSGAAGLVEISARKAVATDVPQISMTLAAAFQDDPVFMWLFDDPRRRKEILPRLFDTIAGACLADEEVYTEDRGVSAAIWSPPGVDRSDDFGPAAMDTVEEYGDRLMRTMEMMEEVHPTEPHHYLFVLGTRPEWQSRGFGSALMSPVLEICDREGLPAYLEATNERNVSLYLRKGFEITGLIELPDGPALTCMWREPA